MEFVSRGKLVIIGEASEAHIQGSADGETDVMLHQSVDSSCGAVVIISHLWQSSNNQWHQTKVAKLENSPGGRFGGWLGSVAQARWLGQGQWLNRV